MLHKYVKPTDKVLMVGCGNSRLSEDMYDVGYHSIVNIDISDIVICQMTERNAEKREEMTFEKMDVTQMTYDDGNFSVAVDKGTLDALAVDQEEATLATVNAMFKEVSRVLRLGGRYVIISLLQDQVIQILVRHFSQCSWPIRIHRVDAPPEESGEGGGDNFSLPVFAVVITKFKDMPNMKQIVEVCSGEGSPQRLDSIEQLLSTVKEMQYYGIVRHQLATKQVKEKQLQINLFSHLASSARYSMWVVDSDHRCDNKFAIFIVPQGRETDWMFSTDAGRKLLSESAGFERLVVVVLSREHEYESMDSIKAELSSKVMELAPPSHKKGVQVPFLSIGEDIGSRTVRHRGHSQMSGDYIVEDAEGEADQTFRRLVFLANQNLVQSEVRLVAPPSEKKKKKKGGKKGSGSLQIDKSYLACGHHHAMVAGLAFLPEQVSKPKVLLVGLGGGPLAAFINQHFPQVQLEAVEIDEEMSHVATDWFGFHHNNNVTVHITDGLDFIAKLAQKDEKQDVVMFDVDSKDSSIGLSCPPPAFVTPEFLKTTADTLGDEGVFVLNCVCRDASLQKSIVERISDIFSCVTCVDIPQEVNKVIFASKSFKATADCAENSDAARSQKELLQSVSKAVQKLDRDIGKVSTSCDVNLAGCIADLQILSMK
ncbi:eEF1A lysine and N-terminal methyltransferase-like isoform X2 [Littorina saxatilis]